ncbi:MAG: hypothetical protein QGI78_08340 [Phycisphaerales bacterium]|jgi:hypothetical protein|nr:hypothetical protein [Phycisphaerales bacterium]
MKKTDNTLTYIFVVILTVMVWLWAAGNTKSDTSFPIKLHFTPPEGSNSTISPDSTTAEVTFHGSRSGLRAAKDACSEGLTIAVPTTSGTPQIDLASRIAEIDAIRETGIQITGSEPKSVTLNVQSMVSVEAAVVPVLNDVQISGDITVDPATVTLLIPSSIRDTLPEAIKVTATLTPNELAQLKHGVVQTKDASVRLPSPLDIPNVSVSPSTVSISFKIQSNTAKTEIPQVRILIAGPSEDYSSYTIELPRKILSNITVEADAEIIDQINNGTANVFAVVRLASRELEQGIERKNIASFLAINEDGEGSEVTPVIEDPSILDIELIIEPLHVRTTTE